MVEPVVYLAWLTSVWLIAMGVYGVLTSANVLRALVSIETLFNGVLVALLLAALTRTGLGLAVDTGILVLAAVILTAVEVAVLAAIILLLYRTKHTIRVEELREVRG